MGNVNLVAVLLCGVSSMVLGAIWYAPFLFGRRWQREVGLSDSALAAGNMAMIYGLAFLLSCLAALALEHFMSAAHLLQEDRDVGMSVAVGAAAGVFWVAASFGINYLFERRSIAHWLINAGYHVLQFALFEAILGLMG